MASAYQHRLTIIIPVDKVAAMVVWFKANIGANSVPDDIGPALTSKNGKTITHRWCCGSFTDDQCKKILKKLAEESGVTPLTDVEWNQKTKSQKMDWVDQNKNNIKNANMLVQISDNELNWKSPDVALSDINLDKEDKK